MNFPNNEFSLSLDKQAVYFPPSHFHSHPHSASKSKPQGRNIDQKAIQNASHRDHQLERINAAKEEKLDDENKISSNPSERWPQHNSRRNFSSVQSAMPESTRASATQRESQFSRVPTYAEIARTNGVGHRTLSSSSSSSSFQSQPNSENSNFSEKSAPNDVNQSSDSRLFRFNQEIEEALNNGDVSLESILEVFEKIKTAQLKPDVVTYNLKITYHVKKNDKKGVMATFIEMENNKVKANQDTYYTLLKFLVGRSDAIGTRRVLLSMDENGFKRDEFTFNMCLKLFVNRKEEQEAREVLQSMEENGIKPTVDIYNAFLKTFVEDKEKFREVLARIDKKEIKPNQFTYKRCLKYFLGWNDVQGIREVLASMDKNEFWSNQSIHLLLQHFRNRGNAEGVAEVMSSMEREKVKRKNRLKEEKLDNESRISSNPSERMSQHNSRRIFSLLQSARSESPRGLEKLEGNNSERHPNEVQIHLMNQSGNVNDTPLNSYFSEPDSENANFSEKSEPNDVAQSFDSNEPNDVAQSSDARLFRFNQEIEDAVNNEDDSLESILEVFEKIKAAQLKPDVVTYNLKITYHVKKSDRKGVMATFIEMENNKVKANQDTYYTLLKFLVSRCDVRGTRRVLWSMDKNGFKRDEFTFNMHLKLMMLKVDVQGAREVLQNMEENGVKPTVETYNNFLKIFVVNKDKEGLREVLATMDKKEVKPDQGTYIMCLKLFRVMDDVQGMREVMASMYKDGIWSMECFQILLNFFRGKRDDEGFAEVLAFRVRMKRKERKKQTENIYLTSLKAFVDQGDEQGAREVLATMDRNKIKPNEFIYTSMVRLYLNLDELEKAIENFDKIGIKIDMNINKIDLHGYSRAVACIMVHKFLKERKKWPNFVITGVGYHSSEFFGMKNKVIDFIKKYHPDLTIKQNKLGEICINK